MIKSVSRSIMALVAMLFLFLGCSSEENSTNNVPVPSVQSIQPIGKSDQIILQFTQLAGMGANSEIQPEFILSINNKDDYIVVAISSKVNLITPGSSIILDNPFPIKVVRYLPYE